MGSVLVMSSSQTTKRRRSDIRKQSSSYLYYNYDRETGRAICNECLKVDQKTVIEGFPSGGLTSQLFSHLAVKHDISKESCDQYQAQLKKGEATTGERLQPTLAVSLTGVRLSTPDRKNQNQHGEETSSQERYSTLIQKSLIKNNNPLNLYDDEITQELFSGIPGFKSPSSARVAFDLSQNCARLLNEVAQTLVDDDIPISLSFNEVNIDGNSFVAINSHFIHDATVNELTLGFIETSFGSASLLKQAVSKTIGLLGLKDQVISITTEMESSSAFARELLIQEKEFPSLSISQMPGCSRQLLNWVASGFIRDFTIQSTANFEHFTKSDIELRRVVTGILSYFSRDEEGNTSTSINDLVSLMNRIALILNNSPDLKEHYTTIKKNYEAQNKEVYVPDIVEPNEESLSSFLGSIKALTRNKAILVQLSQRDHLNMLPKVSPTEYKVAYCIDLALKDFDTFIDRLTSKKFSMNFVLPIIEEVIMNMKELEQTANTTSILRQGARHGAIKASRYYKRIKNDPLVLLSSLINPQIKDTCPNFIFETITEDPQCLNIISEFLMNNGYIKRSRKREMDKVDINDSSSASAASKSPMKPASDLKKVIEKRLKSGLMSPQEYQKIMDVIEKEKSTDGSHSKETFTKSSAKEEVMRFFNFIESAEFYNLPSTFDTNTDYFKNLMKFYLTDTKFKSMFPNIQIAIKICLTAQASSTSSELTSIQARSRWALDGKETSLRIYETDGNEDLLNTTLSSFMILKSLCNEDSTLASLEKFNIEASNEQEVSEKYILTLMLR